MHSLFVRRAFLELIRLGEKTAGLRYDSVTMRLVQVGDSIRFNNDPDCIRLIRNIQEYEDLEQALASVDLARVAPGITSDEARSLAGELFGHRTKAKGFLLFDWGDDDQSSNPALNH